jgi:hypothetical protein
MGTENISVPVSLPFGADTTVEGKQPDQVAYLIAEFETIALEFAREIDRLNARIRELENAAVNTKPEIP